MTTKPGPRAAILAYLSTNGLCTLDDIMAGIGEGKRERVASNIPAAIQDELIDRKRDDVTHQPVYQITTKGKNWLTHNTGTSTPPSPKKAAAVATQQATRPDGNFGMTEQLRESRANELALSQTITEICCAMGADPAKTSTADLMEMFRGAQVAAVAAREAAEAKDRELIGQAALVVDLRQRLDGVTQQSLKDIELLTEKNRKLHEELEHLRATPPAAAALVEARTPTGYAVFDSTGGTTRHKRIEAANRSAARSIRAGASQADVVATYIVARARRGVQIDKV